MTAPVRTLRKAITMRAKLQAALLAAGFDWEAVSTPFAISFDHDPALGLRDQIQDGDKIVFVPDQNDPRYIVPRLDAAHKVKTNGTKATCADGDTHKIAKARRLTKQQQEFRDRMMAKDAGEEPPPKRSKWPTRKFGSAKS